MDVIFVASWYPSKLHATNGNFIEQHARAVVEAGGNVQVVHMAFSRRVLVPQIKESTEKDITVYHLLIPKILETSKTAKQLLFKKIISQFDTAGFNPKIVHGHVVFPAGELALFLSDHYKAPLAYTEHWSGYKPVNAERFTEKVHSLTKEVLQNTDLILPVSHDLGESMKAKGFPGNYAVVNNTVDTSIFYPRKQKQKQNEKFRFLHVSNFDPKAKNTEGIIRGFLDGKFENAHLTIAGDGDIDGLRTFMKSLDRDDSNIEFIGALDYSGVADLMRSSDCFILFSNFENLPCVIAEAHCCGLPVLATEVGGIPEMIDPENGLLIPPGDEGELIAGMQKMIEKRESFNSSEIAEKAAKRYSLITVGEQFLAHYRDLLR